MKSMFKVITLLFISFSGTSYADVWTESGQIEGVWVDMRDGSERVLVRHSVPRNKAADGCEHAGEYYELDINEPLFKEAYSMLLSLEARSEKVRLNLSGCTSSQLPLIQIIDSVNI